MSLYKEGRGRKEQKLVEVTRSESWVKCDPDLQAAMFKLYARDMEQSDIASVLKFDWTEDEKELIMWFHKNYRERVLARKDIRFYPFFEELLAKGPSCDQAKDGSLMILLRGAREEVNKEKEK